MSKWRSAGRFALIRLVQLPVAIVGILTVLFVLIRLSGDPALILAGPNPTPAVVAALHRQLGLDRPLWQQYLLFLGGVVHLDFGESVFFGGPALPLTLGSLLPSLILVVAAQAIAVIVAFVIGIYGAISSSGFARALIVSAFVGQSIPFFWLALMLVLIFALTLRVLPPTGSAGWQYLLLPVTALTLPQIATLTRLVRGQFIDVLRQPFITAAYSRGLSTGEVLFLHALPNAVPPLLSWIAVQFSFLIGALIILEPIFNYHGLGLLLVQGVTNRDYAVVQAGVFLIALLVLGVNTAADVINHILDPRLRVAARE